MKRKIYIIEDEKSINRGIELTLEKEKYEFRNFYNLSDVRDINDADFILDINIPDGLDFLKIIGKYSQNPVLILTANDTEIAEVEDLQFGIDDYVTKPFSLMALRLRIEKILSRNAGNASYSVGRVEDKIR